MALCSTKFLNESSPKKIRHRQIDIGAPVGAKKNEDTSKLFSERDKDCPLRRIKFSSEGDKIFLREG